MPVVDLWLAEASKLANSGRPGDTRMVTLTGDAHTCACTSTPKATTHCLGKLSVLIAEGPEIQLLGIRARHRQVGTGTHVPEGLCASAACDHALCCAD